jgi:predicted lipoprotein with Yx(FWY)xxD motif
MTQNFSSVALLCLALSGAALVPALAAEPAKVGETSKGKAYVDMKGMTLYTYAKDSKDKSACDGSCATNWPPLKASATDKASGEWTIVTRTDGSKQWAYEGKPLYTWIKDTKPGEATGDGVGGNWHIAKP